MATNCHEMRLDEVYACKDCGIELKVVKECKDCGEPAETCECEPCTFTCCGEPLTKKE